MRELYQETIMGHNKAPHNFHVIEDASAQAHGHNPLCGDKLTVFLRQDGDTITEAAFVGQGCAISKSSASMMTDALKGRSAKDAVRLSEDFIALVMREGKPDLERLGKLKVFAGVGEFPARVKCAALPWRTLVAAIEGAEEPASTE
jgi:nitrogen fixation protein NifU and related proteins